MAQTCQTDVKLKQTLINNDGKHPVLPTCSRYERYIDASCVLLHVVNSTVLPLHVENITVSPLHIVNSTVLSLYVVNSTVLPLHIVNSTVLSLYVVNSTVLPLHIVNSTGLSLYVVNSTALPLHIVNSTVLSLNIVNSTVLPLHVMKSAVLLLHVVYSTAEADGARWQWRLRRRQNVTSFTGEQHHFLFQRVHFLRLQLHQLDDAMALVDVSFTRTSKLARLKTQTSSSGSHLTRPSDRQPSY